MIQANQLINEKDESEEEKLALTSQFILVITWIILNLVIAA